MNCRQKYYQNHKEDYKKNFQNYKNNNYQNLKSYNRKWMKNNPEKLLKYHKKHLSKITNTLKLSIYSLHWSLHAWSLSVRKRDNHICQNCGRPAVHAHHIFKKIKYPGLALNLNNGISLCLSCHQEVD